MKHTSFLPLLARAFDIPLRAPLHQQLPKLSSPRSTFSTTSALLKKREKGPAEDKRARLIKYYLKHPAHHNPRGPRFSRLRGLRHWTIARAWSVLAAQRRRAHQGELARQHAAMRAACEALRTGAGDGGRLFRRAMDKLGTWGGRSDLGGVAPGRESGAFGRVEKGREAGVPIEYARGLVETPPRAGWDVAWT